MYVYIYCVYRHGSYTCTHADGAQRRQQSGQEHLCVCKFAHMYI